MPVILKRKGFWLLFAMLLVVAFFIRSYQIDLRPFHNDEGVNYFFFEGVRDKGYYSYSHENYHGPSYFYLSTLLSSDFLLGDSELGIRSSAILCGVLLILVLLPLRRYEGKCFFWLSAFLVTFSSSLVFYSRYAIHETLFLLAAAWMGISLYRWWWSGDKKLLYQIGASLGLIISTKETFIISLFCLFFAFMALGDYKRWFKMLCKQWQHVLASLLLAVIIIVAFFTGGFQWSDGIREMFMAVPQWIGRNTSDTGHFKSCWYYIDMLFGSGLRDGLNFFGEVLGNSVSDWFDNAFYFKPGRIYLKPSSGGTEWYLALFFLFPLLSLITRPRYFVSKCISRRAAFFRFSFTWALLSFVVYSLVDYKTPWLVINIVYPMVLCLAWMLASFYRTSGKTVGNCIAIPVCVLAVFLTWAYNFRKSYLVCESKNGVFDESVSLRLYDLVNFVSDSAPFILALILLILALTPLRQRKFMAFLPAVVVLLFIDLNYKFKKGCPFTDLNPYSYVHTSQGMINMVNEIKEYEKGLDHPIKILVGSHAYWPLPYYLRAYKNGGLAYSHTRDPQRVENLYDAMIIDNDVKFWNEKWHISYYRLTDAQEANLYLRVK